MKKIICLLMAMVFCMSCAYATVETKGKDQAGGATCKATYTSAFKSLTDIKLTACHASGEASSSTVDPAAAVLTDLFLKALTTKAAAPVTPAP